jgi:ABC-type multidrug transport system fused ATPase/permease subunit
MFFSSPIEVVVASVFLYSLLGWSAFSGIIVLVVAMPINTYLSKKSVKIYKEAMKARDKRLSVMNELIGAITFIKFFAWTDKWKKRVTDARTAELKQEVRSIVLGVFFGLVWALVPILVTLCSFFSYIVIAKQELTIAIAFTAIALFSMLQAPLNSIPTFWMWILQALVSVGRVEDFLGEEEVPDWVSSLKRQNERPTGPIKIAFEKATLRWNSGKKKAAENAEAATPASETSPEITEPSAADTTTVAPSSANSTKEVFELTGINVNFPLGKLTVITGPTGSGKTALLTALLGEMDLIEGETFLPKYPTDFDAPTGLRNSIAYAAQTPWLQQQSIKDNILFGEHFDEERYEAVVDACALRTDFDILEDGDETEIGAKGVSLSGGQKARVALARAVYSYTQHLLLDDPLAAVDSHTAKHLVDECLNGPLLRGRTVLLVSHHLDLLVSSADYIVRVVDGRIDSQGTPKELDQEGQLDGIVAVEEAIAAQEEPVQAEDVAEEIAEAEAEAAKPKKEKKKGPGRKLIKDEERAVGNVKSSTYMFYIRSATYLIWFIWAIVLIIEEAGSIGQSLWLKFWGEAYNQHVDTIKTFAHPGAIMTSSEFPMWHDLRGNFVHATPSSLVNSTSPAFVVQSVFDALPNPPASTHPGYYLAGYTIIVLVTGLIGVTSSIVGSWGSYLASKKIHEELLDSVLGGTVRFFNTTPLGRIINRFSKDIDTIDGGLGSMIRTMVSMIASLLARLFLVAAIVPGFIVPAAIISFLYFQYAIIYLRTGRSLRRLEATLRSPIFSGFSELLDGVISVRAFGAETRFFEKLCGQVDMSHSAHYYYWMTNRWVSGPTACQY